jgi:hypothetical protein
VSLYDVSVAVHVAAALAGFGPTFAYPVVQLAAERGDRAALPFALAAILRISRTLAVPGAVVVGLTGALAGNVALGVAAAAMAAVVIAYEPISPWLVLGAAAGALVLIAALVRPRLR